MSRLAYQMEISNANTTTCGIILAPFNKKINTVQQDRVSIFKIN